MMSGVRGLPRRGCPRLFAPLCENPSLDSPGSAHSVVDVDAHQLRSLCVNFFSLELCCARGFLAMGDNLLRIHGAGGLVVLASPSASTGVLGWVSLQCQLVFV